MYHVGPPGEDGFTERVLASWGVDGHNSHTNVCSSGGRAGYHYWMGIDRPSPDHANAKVILLISAHLESGHYFNPHAQRIMEAKQAGAKLIVFDTRLSNTATHADLLALAVAGLGGGDPAGRRQPPHRDRPLRPRVRPPLVELGGVPRCRRAGSRAETFERVRGAPRDAVRRVHLRVRGGRVRRRGRDDRRQLADIVAEAGTALSTHTWRSAAAGNLGGWQVSRTLFLLNCLLGAVATPGGTYPNAWNKFVPRADAPAGPSRTPGTS